MVKEKVGDKAMAHGMIWKTVGAENSQDAIDNYEKYKGLYDEYSPYNHLDANDPPVILIYAIDKKAPDKITDDIHSAKFGIVLKEKSDKLGAKVHLIAPTASVCPYKNGYDFIIGILCNPPPLPGQQ
jgi:hypothetical protein